MVAGRWTERQFAEDRLPTRAEISAAAPKNRQHHVPADMVDGRVVFATGRYAGMDEKWLPH